MTFPVTPNPASGRTESFVAVGAMLAVAVSCAGLLFLAIADRPDRPKAHDAVAVTVPKVATVHATAAAPAADHTLASPMKAYAATMADTFAAIADGLADPKTDRAWVDAALARHAADADAALSRVYASTCDGNAIRDRVRLRDEFRAAGEALRGR